MFCIHSVGAYPPSSLSSNDDDAARSDSGIGVQYSAAIPSPAETASFGFASRRDCTLATSGEGDARTAFAVEETPPPLSNVRADLLPRETTTDTSAVSPARSRFVERSFASVGGPRGAAVSVGRFVSAHASAAAAASSAAFAAAATAAATAAFAADESTREASSPPPFGRPFEPPRRRLEGHGAMPPGPAARRRRDSATSKGDDAGPPNAAPPSFHILAATRSRRGSSATRSTK